MTADTPISKTPFLCSNRGQIPFEHVYLMIRRTPPPHEGGARRPPMGPGAQEQEEASVGERRRSRG